jgi:glucose-6-phosphate-specific signal transduction histidine kinase
MSSKRLMKRKVVLGLCVLEWKLGTQGLVKSALIASLLKQRASQIAEAKSSSEQTSFANQVPK